MLFVYPPVAEMIYMDLQRQYLYRNLFLSFYKKQHKVGIMSIFFRKFLLFLILIETLSCSANDDIRNTNQTNQALANIDNQLANLEFQKVQINQQFNDCLVSIQVPQISNYYFGGDDVAITLAQGNMLLAQTAQMTTCGQTANYQFNQIEYNRSSLLYQRSLLEQKNKINLQSPINNNIVSPVINTTPNEVYRQRADEAHQRQLELIREQGNFNLRKDCNNSSGTWLGRSVGCH